MIITDKIDRDYTMDSDRQKRKIVRQYKELGRNIICIFSAGSKYIKVIWK